MFGDIVGAILKAIARLFFQCEALLGRLLDLLYEVFEVFAGISPVAFKGTKGPLLSAFFNNDVVSTIYWGMAAIGIAMTFGFAIAAVIKKGFDSTGEKVKATYGMIIGNVLKALLLILLMTAIVSATITATSLLMQQIDYLFDNADEINDPNEIYFDNSDYATMFRIVDTIGNYSLNASYNTRFNINSCFNAIRMDMQLLDNHRVFNYTYDVNDEAKNSWQAALLEIYNAGDIYQDQPLDKYNAGLTAAITNCVERIQKDASFKPLSYYYRGYTHAGNNSLLGRTVMIASSFSAANNKKYNENPSINDNIRGPFYAGRKDIYDLDTVEKSFDVSFDTWNHLVAIFVNLLLLMEFLKILVNCTARIFNVMLLYVTAPGFISVMPLDDGGKMKQWTTAFVIQSLSIFGTVIAVRLMIVFIPIILSADLVLFENAYKNIMAKIVLIIGICMTSQKASGMISGILADNAGYQSIIAGDVGSGVVAKGLSLGGRGLKGALSLGKGIAKGVGKVGKGLATATGLSTLYDKTIGAAGQQLKNYGTAMRQKWGVWGAGNPFTATTKEQDAKSAEERDKNQKAQEDSQFRTGLISSINGLGSSMRDLYGGQKGTTSEMGTQSDASDGSSDTSSKGSSAPASFQDIKSQFDGGSNSSAPQGRGRSSTIAKPPVPPKQNPVTQQRTRNNSVSFSAANKAGYAKKGSK